MQQGHRLLCFIYLLTFTSTVLAVDIVKLSIRNTNTKAYQKELISQALKASESKYGSYELIVHLADISSNRVFKELDKGTDQYININVGLTSIKRESSAIPIFIPLRKGLLNYRLLLVNEENVAKFSNVMTIEDLKQHSVGLLYDWVTTGIMKKQHFNIVESPSYDGLFRMLKANRFDYAIFGANDIYKKLQQPHIKNKKFVILPNIAVYIPSPSYIFVSKNAPRIAERLEWGMEKMIADGSFDQIFYQYHSEDINNADLKNRTIINIPTDYLGNRSAYERPELWYTPNQLTANPTSK